MKLKQWASLGVMWILTQAVGYAADVNVTVLWQGGTGTFTTNVNVYVDYVGQSKTLSVTPQSGYRFKGNVNTAPSGLTVTGSQGNYTLTIVSGNKQGSVQVTGKIEPVPSGGGGGPPPERPFDISVLQKWAYIYHSVPSNGTNLIAGVGSTNDLTSLVRLGTGQAASGNVNWSSSVGGSFTANNVALAAGSASTQFIAPTTAGSGTITATGQNLKDTGNISVQNVSTNLTATIVSVGIGSIPRVPVYGGSSPIEKSVAITVQPSGVSINLEITSVSGSGSATFDDGSTTKSITANATVKIRGTANSSTPNNLRLAAKLGAQTCASQTFSVRTWPINFRQTSSSASGGILEFHYQWDSESGALADLTDIGAGEIVTYPSGYYPNPPYNGTSPNPTIVNNIPGTDGALMDTHSHPPFQTPYSATSFVAIQYYRFRDTVLDSSTYINMMGPIDITRSTYQSGSNWIYKIEKSGIDSTITIP